MLAATIALRHLGRRRRQTLVSVLGVALGVGFFIAVTSLMRGFQTYFVAQVIDVAPHITIKDEHRAPRLQPAVLAHPDGAVSVRGVKPREELRGIRNARGLIAELETIPGVAVAPGLRGAALLRYGSRDVTATIAGIDPPRERRVGNIEKDMIAGRLEDLRATANGIILGIGLAERLGAGIGDTITAVAASGTARAFKVVGLVATGITAIDNGEAYVLLKLAQVLQNRPNVINAIRLRLDDVRGAEPLARRIEAAHGWRTESWEEANRNVLSLFVIQNAIMFSVVGAILLVAAFGIYSIISTVVHEKARDIAILKSLGFTEGDILRIFTIEGVLVGAAGAVLGALVGEGLIFGLSQVRFEEAGGVIRGTGGFILARELWPYLAGGGFALLAAAVAALVPARRAASLNPVEIVRGAA
ncbi:ABC transporter permease [Elioraea tepida]|uniref:ABC transporter permease n=1 Tax=Elioraea tepida TaxID=2843330 RepID=A0A975U4E2_9PROT|nr:ABC transporter permease [Elioraea tepida]QXM25158.1 ABC transporter permease [Elioraea tepida]